MKNGKHLLSQLQPLLRQTIALANPALCGMGNFSENGPTSANGHLSIALLN